jgi:hypothetical protein
LLGIHPAARVWRAFIERHGYIRLQGELVRAFLLATYVYQWAREGLKWLVGHKRPLRGERMRAYRQVLRSGLRATQREAQGCREGTTRPIREQDRKCAP